MRRFMRNTNRWMLGGVAALLSVMVVVGCGGAEEKPAVSGAQKEGDGHVHKEDEKHWSRHVKICRYALMLTPPLCESSQNPSQRGDAAF
jgi:hypothetical protein